MGFLDRFLLLIYALGVFVLSLGAIIIFSQLVSADFIWNNFLYLTTRWETIAIAGVLVLLSLRLVKVSLSRVKQPKLEKNAVIVHGQMGDVEVAVAAVQNLVDKTARNVKGVRDVKVQVVVNKLKQPVVAEDDVKIKINIVIGQESNVTAVSDQVRTLVQNSLTEIVGLPAFTVEVLVDDISNAAVQKQRVV